LHRSAHRRSAVASFDTDIKHTRPHLSNLCRRRVLKRDPDHLSETPCLKPISHLASALQKQLQPHRAKLIHAASSPIKPATHLLPNTEGPADVQPKKNATKPHPAKRKTKAKIAHATTHQDGHAYRKSSPMSQAHGQTLVSRSRFSDSRGSLWRAERHNALM
jgi:hypothetical protein